MHCAQAACCDGAAMMPGEHDRRFLRFRPEGSQEAGTHMPIDDVHERVEIPNQIPPGVPGAGWLVAILAVFSILVITATLEGWTTQSRPTANAPAHHTSTGAGARGPN